MSDLNFVKGFRTSVTSCAPGKNFEILFEAKESAAWVHSVRASNSASVALSVRLYLAKARTKAVDMGTGQIVGITNIVRTAGDFVRDGWRAGSLCLLHHTQRFFPVPFVVQSVTATQLSFPNGVWAFNEVFAAGVSLFNPGVLLTASIPSQAGINPSVGQAKLISSVGTEGFVPGRFLTLAPGDVLAGEVFSSSPVSAMVNVVVEAVDLGVP